MKNGLIFTGVLTAFAGLVNAQTGSGTMGITADVMGSINLTFVTDASGLAVTGTTTSAASLPFGNVQMFGGSVPANVTKTLSGVASFTLSTPFDIRVDLANSSSLTYTLSATLSSADAVNGWLINAIDISSGSITTITALGAYATAVPYTLHLTVPASEANGAISNSVNFTAVGN